MADGGAGTLIMTITALLIAGIASNALIQSWDGMSDIYADQREQAQVDSKTEVSLAGDLMNVDCNDADDEITFYLQNTGTNTLNHDKTSIAIFANGAAVTTDTVTFVDGATTSWISGELIKVVGTSSSAISDGDEIILTIIVESKGNPKGIGTGDTTGEVRLV